MANFGELARSLWPEIKDPGEALGRRARVGDPEVISCEVIGVAKDSKNNIFNSIAREPAPTIYHPFAQNYTSSASVVVRASGDPSGLIPSVRREVAALDENLPAQDLQPLAETTGLATWSVRTAAAALSFFGLIGLALACVGIYGVMSYSVAQTHARDRFTDGPGRGGARCREVDRQAWNGADPDRDHNWPGFIGGDDTPHLESALWRKSDRSRDLRRSGAIFDGRGAARLLSSRAQSDPN
ncbi:MAG TPA: hypothetical protein VI260_34800 [Blastocatellia bacterium]|jgi:hypothetical protein